MGTAKDAPDKCPPHWFEAAWTGTEENSTGAIFCRWCGEIRPLEVQKIEAPVEERIEGRKG